MPKAEKFAVSKKPQWERAVVAYLLALYHEDTKEAHGLYCLAQKLLSEEKFLQIQQPDYKNFSSGYAAWRLMHSEPELIPYYTYPDSMELLNKIYKTKIAVSRLHQPYLENAYMSAREKKQRVLDIDAMLGELVETLLEYPIDSV